MDTIWTPFLSGDLGKLGRLRDINCLCIFSVVSKDGKTKLTPHGGGLKNRNKMVLQYTVAMLVDFRNVHRKAPTSEWFWPLVSFISLMHIGCRVNCIGQLLIVSVAVNLVRRSIQTREAKEGAAAAAEAAPPM